MMPGSCLSPLAGPCTPTWLCQLADVVLQLRLTAAGPHDLPEQRPVVRSHSSLSTRQAEEQLHSAHM
jgi:hypothetical protein